MSADIGVEDRPEGLVLTRAAIPRTARRIMDGTAYVPLSRLPLSAGLGSRESGTRDKELVARG
jgi:hypothetical protein